MTSSISEPMAGAFRGAHYSAERNGTDDYVGVTNSRNEGRVCFPIWTESIVA